MVSTPGILTQQLRSVVVSHSRLCPATCSVSSSSIPVPITTHQQNRSFATPSSSSSSRPRGTRASRSARSSSSSGGGGRGQNMRNANGSFDQDPTRTADWVSIQKNSQMRLPFAKLDYEKEQPTKFVLDDAPDEKSRTGFRLTEQQRPVNDTLTPYSDFVGNRFPTLSTAKNWRYWKERGLNRLKVRKFPIHVDAWRRMDPYMREYIFFLHTFDSARFSIPKIAERYRLKEETVRMVLKEYGENYFIRSSGLSSYRRKQFTREQTIMYSKERAFKERVGHDQMGDGEDDVHEHDEEFGGWKSTSDWVRRQNMEVEMMSAYPMGQKRDPMPKRVDVDVVVDQTTEAKVMNWIDPYDKVVF